MVIKKITSTANQNIKDIVRLRDKGSSAEFLIEGPHLLEMALNAGIKISSVFVSEAFTSRKENQELLNRLSASAQNIYEVAPHVLQKITETETPQGIVAVVSLKSLKPDELTLNPNPFITVIDGIQDPGNLGSIIRTADAAGADAVLILPGTCNVFMPKVIRATAGSMFNIPVIHIEMDELLNWLHEKNIRLAITSADAETSVFKADLRESLAIVFGSEAHGVRGILKKAANFFLKIPILGRAESLNVAASAAICLYEVSRQRQ